MKRIILIGIVVGLVVLGNSSVFYGETYPNEKYPHIVSDNDPQRSLRIEGYLGILELPTGIISCGANVDFRLGNLAYFSGSVMDTLFNPTKPEIDLLAGYPLLNFNLSWAEKLTISSFWEAIATVGRPGVYRYYDIKVPARLTILPMVGLRFLPGNGITTFNDKTIITDKWGSRYLKDAKRTTATPYMALAIGARGLLTWDCNVKVVDTGANQEHKGRVDGNTHLDAYLLMSLSGVSDAWDKEKKEIVNYSLIGYYAEVKYDLPFSPGGIEGAYIIGFGLMPGLAGSDKGDELKPATILKLGSTIYF